MDPNFIEARYGNPTPPPPPQNHVHYVGGGGGMDGYLSEIVQRGGEQAGKKSDTI